MQDGMPDALTVIGTAARIERAWCEITTSERNLASLAISASVALAVCLAVGSPSLGAAAMCWGACGATLALAAVVDVHERRLPNTLLALALLTSLLPACLRADVGMAMRAVIGGALAGALLMIVRVARGVGMGDVKMAVVVGVSVGAIGWRLAPIAIGVAAAAGAAYGAARRQQRVAFGPALWFGWMSALVGLSTGWWS
jgi:Flp pilus assembly protein protease CpaA